MQIMAMNLLWIQEIRKMLRNGTKHAAEQKRKAQRELQRKF